MSTPAEITGTPVSSEIKLKKGKIAKYAAVLALSLAGLGHTVGGGGEKPSAGFTPVQLQAMPTVVERMGNGPSEVVAKANPEEQHLTEGQLHSMEAEVNAQDPGHDGVYQGDQLVTTHAAPQAQLPTAPAH